jgi:hypothetical protein
MKILLLVFIPWFMAIHLNHASPGGDTIIKAIKQDDYKYIAAHLNAGNINKIYGKDSIPLLHLAARLNKERVFQLLLEKGANTSIAYKGEPILVSTTKSGNRKLVRALLKHGANVNIAGTGGNTALMYAVLNKDIKMVKLLARWGANTGQKNHNNINARELSLGKGTMEITKYLKSAFERRLPSYLDGPHVEWNKHFTRAKVSYLVHDSTRQLTKKISTRYNIDGEKFEFKGFAGDTNQYLISKAIPSTSTSLDTTRNIFVMGDVHGDYQNLVLFLSKMNIIDDQNNWKWANNYLVFIGDIFDRGDKVTECLWLIYKLERQAKEAGGEVVFLLGNHELMVMENDLRYIAKKYYYLSDKLRLEYSRFFQPHMELGRWLRAKPVMVKAGKILFVHGGISPEIIQYQLNMDEINELMNTYLLGGGTEVSDTTGMLLGNHGPLWYRGLIDDNRFFIKIQKDEIKPILEHFEVEKIIVGHTNVPRVSTFFDGSVIAIDVPFYRTGDKNSMQGLIISGDKIRVIEYNGRERKIQ